MKLRYFVDRENCFRRGIDFPSSVHVIDVDPNTLSDEVRNMIADRLMSGTHLGEEVMDVCWLKASEAYVEKDTLYICPADSTDYPDGVSHLVTAKLPGLDHLVEAIREEENELVEYLEREQLKHSKRSGR